MIDPDLLEHAAQIAGEQAAWAADHIRHAKVKGIQEKAHPADVVTEVDRVVEQHVRQACLRQLPGSAFVGEEFGATDPQQLTWYCDPVDGTTNFATGLGWHSFSLALADEDGAVVAAVAHPRSRDIFTAVRGQGARLKGKKLSVPLRSELAGSVLLTEWLANAPWQGQMDVMRALGEAYVTVRIMGSGTLSMTSLAAGRGQAGIIGKFGPVDHAAALLICHEAGLAVRDASNRETLWPVAAGEREGFLIANPGLADQIFKLWDAAAH